MAKFSETKKYLNEIQVSEITGRAVQTLRNDRHRLQGIPYVRLGRSIRYDYDDVISFMDEHKVQPLDSRRI